MMGGSEGAWVAKKGDGWIKRVWGGDGWLREGWLTNRGEGDGGDKELRRGVVLAK